MRSGQKVLYSKCLANTIKALPQFPSFYLDSPNQLKKAEKFSQGRIVINGSAYAPEELSWKNDPFGQRSSLGRLLYHSLHDVRDLLTDSSSTKNPEMVRISDVLAENWMKECLDWMSVENIWSDHATAFRTFIFCYIWEEFQERQSPNEEFGIDILWAIQRHGHILSEKWFYREDHDHGVTQAYALFALGLLFPQLPESSKWVDLGESRLEHQMQAYVSIEGVHREHSPYYHFFVFRQFFYAYNLGQANEYNFSKVFQQRLLAMLRVGAFLVGPDSRMASLGDSHVNSPILIDTDDRAKWPVNCSEEFLYSTSAGIEGKKPSERSVIYPEGGLAIIRSGWGEKEPFAMERYIMIRLANFNAPHVHQDLGSLEFYAFGKWLLVDSGGPFSYGHTLRTRYFLNSAAHNTIAVHGKAQQIVKSRVLAWESDEDFDYLCFEHDGYPGLVHKRHIVFINQEFLVIIDEVVSEKPERVSQFFHLHENLKVQVKGMQVFAEYVSEGPSLQIIPLITDGLALETYRGISDPPQGWRCVGEGEKVPNGVIEYWGLGAAMRFVALLLPAKQGNYREVKSECVWLESRQTYDLTVTIGDATHHVMVPPSCSPEVTRSLCRKK